MSTAQIIFVFLGIVVTAAGSYGAARYAGRSSVKVKEIDVKADAYAGAQEISTTAMEWMKGQIAEMKQALAEQKAEHEELKAAHEEQGQELRQVKAKTLQVTEDLEISVNWFEQFLIWEHSGSRPPRPHIPEALRKYFSQDLLNRQQAQQDYLENLDYPKA